MTPAAAGNKINNHHGNGGCGPSAAAGFDAVGKIDAVALG